MLVFTQRIEHKAFVIVTAEIRKGDYYPAEADQEAVRAEVLSYGSNLDDLANSDNEYIEILI